MNSDKITSWTLSPALENTKHITINKNYELFIGGKWVSPEAKNYFPTTNPATLEELSHIAYAEEADVNKAVEAAKIAYDSSWSKLSAAERGKYLFRIARLIQEKSKELAIIETLDGGKPIRESRDIDIPLAANHFFYYAGWADKLSYAFPNRKIESIGVVAQIIPWNFPLLMAAWKIAPALACGNTVVLKPAESSSLTALKLAEIIQESGLPDGVVNIITGDGKTGEHLVNHPLVNKIAFTGSTRVGKRIQQQIAATSKKITLELGGKSANIVCEDAALDQAVEGIINGIFFNQGHVCCAGSRLYVQENIAELVIKKLKARINQLQVGNPLDKNTDIGAIHSKEQFEKIQYYVDLGKKEGLEVYESSCKLDERGYFFKPTLFLNVAQSSRINQEEIFGPVLAIQTFRTLEEALQKANNTPYGLAAGIWTSKGSKALSLAKKLKAGVVWINSYNKFDPSSPFGGFKESGFGREGGIHGLAPYLKF